MDPVQSITAITAVLDAIKKARDVARRLKDADMQEVLLDAQERVLALKEELLSLRAENVALKEQLAAKVSATFDGGAYWVKTERGRDGPFCSRCQDVERRLVRLKPTYEFWYHCPSCEQSFEVPSAPRRPDDPPPYA
jgi:acyl-CoA reductase-like NAD-dependent aldehyde dehydrogenase